MYIKCPRCMLNYINEETEQYCKVCLVDMGKIQGQPELDLEEEYKLCPECGENYLEEGEEALLAERRGRACAASGTQKGRKPKLDKQVEEDLIAENQRLRMEIDYLKKLNALVLEEERQNRKHK